MVKFGKKFFFSELPEEDNSDKKVKKVKQKKPEKNRKKIDFKKIFNSIKDKLKDFFEIIVAVLKRIWPIIILLIVVLLLILGIKSCAKKKPAKKKKETPAPIVDIVEPKLNTDIRAGLFDELPTIDMFVTNIDDYKDKKITLTYDTNNLVENHYEEVGEYKVTITIEDKTFESKIVIEDKVAPTLETKNVTITEGTTYKIEDFIEKCEDNSKKACTYEYKDIKYASITAPGTYDVIIIGKDVNGNVVEKGAKLKINKKVTPTPTPTPTPQETCKYGDASYDKTIILSYSVIKNNCAVERSLAKTKAYNEKPNNIANTEYNKVVEEIKKKDLNIKVALEYFVTEVPNSSAKGFVGYTIMFKLYNNTTNELLVDYSLKSDGSRVFKVNKINL